VDPVPAFFSLRHTFPLTGELQEIVARLRVIEPFGDRAQLFGAFAPRRGAAI